VYDPARVNLRSLGTYLSEAAQSTAPYGDWLTPGDVGSLEEIEAGEGGVVRDGIQKVAVYKDSHGHPHFYSAVCPHLNGIVRWNSTEKTWDCPCHGSRFDKHGRVLNGPAACGLREIVPAAVEQEDRASA
jgi:Rieske Fe-S protein